MTCGIKLNKILKLNFKWYKIWSLILIRLVSCIYFWMKFYNFLGTNEWIWARCVEKSAEQELHEGNKWTTDKWENGAFLHLLRTDQVSGEWRQQKERKHILNILRRGSKLTFWKRSTLGIRASSLPINREGKEDWGNTYHRLSPELTLELTVTLHFYLSLFYTLGEGFFMAGGGSF